MLFATSWHQSAEGVIEPEGDRTVLINCFLDRPEVLSFVPDDEAGGHAQAQHLLALGHRRIGVIELPPGMIARDLRRTGLERAFREAGVDVGSVPMLPGQVGPPEARRTVAFDAATALLSLPDRPTALICSKDEFALQAYGAAQALGLSVPGDVSIVGYDDVAVLSLNMRPALTTVRLPYHEMGRLAAHAALSPKAVPPGAATTKGTVPGRHFVPCPLIARDSCRPI
jgi:LacI family transcriptional regulator